MIRLTALLGLMLIATASSAQFLGRDVADWNRDAQGENPGRRRAAAFALGKLGANGAAASETLKTLLAGDPDARVREAAAFALGEIALRVEALRAEAELRQLLVRSLRDGDPLVRRSAAFALGCLGEQAATARTSLEALLNDSRPEVRQSTAWALGRLGGDASIPALRRVLSDDDATVQREAATAFSLLDPDAGRVALQELAQLASHSDIEVRKAGLYALVRIVGPEDAKSNTVIAPLQKALLDGDVENRRNAAFALSNIGGTSAAPAVDVLLDALGSDDLELKRQAAAAFRNLGAAGSRAVEPLIACLTDADADLRGNATLALGGIGRRAEPAVGPLVSLLGNRAETPEIRVKAAVALSMIGDVPPAVLAVPKLLALLTEPRDDGQVRERILWALRVHGAKLRDMPGIEPAFRKILRETPTADNRMVRFDCAYVSGMVFGPKTPAEAFPVLVEYLRDDTLQIYRNTASAVGGTAQEIGSGKASSREVGEGDGRKLVLDALTAIGRETIRDYPEIVAEVRRLAASDRTIPAFRKQCDQFLRTIGR